MNNSWASLRSEENMVWINDIWLCSQNYSFLSDAEHQWLDSRADLALEVAQWVTSHSPSMHQFNLMRVRLFIASLEHSFGNYETSIKNMEAVEKFHQSYESLHNSEYMTIAGIGYSLGCKSDDNGKGPGGLLVTHTRIRLTRL
jgi:hypothetical protein